jgi:asparagine N-glycosylation enzyme membrane subunit Stt3
MYISRGVFQALAGLLMGAIVCVWVFLEDSARIISIVILVLFFVILSLEYVREGFSERRIGSGEPAGRLAESA